MELNLSSSSVWNVTFALVLKRQLRGYVLALAPVCALWPQWAWIKHSFDFLYVRNSRDTIIFLYKGKGEVGFWHVSV